MGGRADHSDSLYENHLGIAPHIPVMDKSKRDDGSFSQEDFTFDKERNVYICPAGKTLTTTASTRLPPPSSAATDRPWRQRSA
jgi:hypothetical protein